MLGFDLVEAIVVLLSLLEEVKFELVDFFLAFLPDLVSFYLHLTQPLAILVQLAQLLLVLLVKLCVHACLGLDDLLQLQDVLVE